MKNVIAREAGTTVSPGFDGYSNDEEESNAHFEDGEVFGDIGIRNPQSSGRRLRFESDDEEELDDENVQTSEIANTPEDEEMESESTENPLETHEATQDPSENRKRNIANYDEYMERIKRSKEDVEEEPELCRMGSDGILPLKNGDQNCLPRSVIITLAKETLTRMTRTGKLRSYEDEHRFMKTEFKSFLKSQYIPIEKCPRGVKEKKEFISHYNGIIRRFNDKLDHDSEEARDYVRNISPRRKIRRNIVGKPDIGINEYATVRRSLAELNIYIAESRPVLKEIQSRTNNQEFKDGM